MLKRLWVLAPFCAVIGFGPSVQAGQATPVEETPVQETSADTAAAILSQMQEKIRPVLSDLGIDYAAIAPRFEPLVRAATPAAPPSGEWAFAMQFENTSSVGDEAEGAAEREPILTQADQCEGAYPEAGPLLQFRPLTRHGLDGHQCLFLDHEDDAAILTSIAYYEGEGRHGRAVFGSAVVVEDDGPAARAVFEPVVAPNLDLAELLLELGVMEMLH